LSVNQGGDTEEHKALVDFDS